MRIGPAPAADVLPVHPGHAGRRRDSQAPTRSTPATGSCPSGPPSPGRSPMPGWSSSGHRPTSWTRWAARTGPATSRWRPGCPSCRLRTRPPHDLDAVAEQVGFPLLVKAAAGGGGKGMRIVRTAADLPEAVAAARREAASAFGDDTMLFERYVEHGRHIEVQILADEHGHVRPPARAGLLGAASPPEGASRRRRRRRSPRRSATW